MRVKISRSGEVLYLRALYMYTIYKIQCTILSERYEGSLKGGILTA